MTLKSWLMKEKIIVVTVLKLEKSKRDFKLIYQAHSDFRH